MKKVKNVFSRIALLFVMAFTQAQAWASDTNGESTAASEVFSQPKFWIGVALFVGFIAAFFIAGRVRKVQELQ